MRRFRGLYSGYLVGLGLAELATMITTIYLHRVLSHKSIELHPAMTFFMRIGTWMLTSISPRDNHHAHPAAPKLSAFRGEFNPAWPVIRLLEALRLAKVTSKVDEGWDKHRRRIPPMAACSARVSATDQPKSG
jgi:fatty-acid desaturase